MLKSDDSGATMDDRELNRATLARQMLLGRVAMPVGTAARGGIDYELLEVARG